MAEEFKPPWELEPRTLIRVEAETNPDYGEDPYKRPLEKLLRLGVINLDKPRGPTSHELAAKVRELLGWTRWNTRPSGLRRSPNTSRRRN